jgi:hypothetical protein
MALNSNPVKAVAYRGGDEAALFAEAVMEPDRVSFQRLQKISLAGGLKRQ